ncbi:MAG: MATE family efflux transporter [Christensenellales bacterium]
MEKNNVKQNKMAVVPMTKLIWKMGLPMIISMILQSIYNIVDTTFVINMGEDGVAGNLALTYAFPIQLLIIAIGVGTGVGINALLSKKLGEKDKKGVSLTEGNGIFLGICIYIIFLLFGLFGAEWFISMQSGGNQEVINMGTNYLKICSCFSFGAIGYTIYERFLQSTGKTLHSTIAQISGAVANIILDYIFIYPCGMGVEGAAWATVIGQVLSLIIAMLLHYICNKEIEHHIKHILPNCSIIKGIYQIGISAALMQGLLAVMMLGMNLILGTVNNNVELLQGSFGIYYKIMQFALFATFGISNTIISILSFNYGMKDKDRVKNCIKWGIIDSIVVSLIITLLFQCLASPLAKLFGMASTSAGNEIQNVVVSAIRIASLGYVFMGISVAIQGVLQAFRYAGMPLVISLLRLCLFVFPIAYLFTLSANAVNILWWTFPIVEVLTSIISLIFLKCAYKRKVETMNVNPLVSDNLIVTISREHGSNGKYIGKLVAEKLGIKYYDKELVAKVAKETGLSNEFIENTTQDVKTFHTLYLSTEVNREAMIAQANVIKKIAQKESCLLVGRGADFVCKDYPNLVKIFIYASPEYKLETVMKLYGDDKELADKNIKKSDNARSAYYNFISGQKWGEKSNYDLCIDSSYGPERTAENIVKFIKSKMPKELLKNETKNDLTKNKKLKRKNGGNKYE